VHALADTRRLWKEHGPNSELKRVSLAGYRVLGLTGRAMALTKIKALLKGRSASCVVRSTAPIKMPAFPCRIDLLCRIRRPAGGCLQIGSQLSIP
jgi:hypothetical protein